MIKRRFYRDTHGDKDAPSESSSSSSGSEVEAPDTDDTDVEEEEDEEKVAPDVRETGEASSSSGYESEDSSVNEVNLDSSGIPTSDEDTGAQIGNEEGNILPNIAQHSPKKNVPDFETADCVLKRKSVFKCRICPRIVCLSEETLKAHLISKKHARSEKLLREGRLKLMLNENGKIEGEEYSDNEATPTASQQKSDKPKKGKRRSNKKKRPRQETESTKAKPSTENRKMRRKNIN